MSKLVQSMFENSVADLMAGDEAEPKPEKPKSKALDASLLTRAFVNLRDARSKLAADFEAKDRELKAMQTRIGNAMLAHLNATKADSVATEAGTFYKQEELTPTGGDWEKFYKWVAENNAFDALERRIKKTFIREYMEANDGAIPPGVSVYREYVVRVRRS